MWSSTVILSVAFCGYLVYGAEISDVTTVYEIGLAKSRLQSKNSTVIDWDELDRYFGYPSREHETTCIHDVAGHVHARTNALGLGLINEKYEYFDSKNLDLPNITCDANFFNEGMCSQWRFGIENKVQIFDEPDGYPWLSIKNGTAYKIHEELIIYKNQNQRDIFLHLTKGAGNLRNEQKYFVILFYRQHGVVYYDCSVDNQYHQYSHQPEMFDRDGQLIHPFCTRYTDFSLSSSSEYFTFTFTEQEGTKFQIYQGNKDSRNRIIDLDYGAHLDINYVSIRSTNISDGNSITFASKAFEITTDDDVVVSPIFTPQSDTLCLAMVLHSSIPVMFSLDIYALELVPGPDDRHLLKALNNIKNGWNNILVNISLENFNPIKLSISKSVPGKISISRIGTCNTEGEEVFELPSSVSICPINDRISLWGSENSSLYLYTTSAEIVDPVLMMTQTNNSCLNGGVLTSAGCACTPGFSGSNCEIGCGKNRFGQDCEGLCSFYSEECRGLLLCTKFTGCRCAPGYHGDDCTQACSPGWYGNDCHERCGHCAGNSSCDIYTGECRNCEEGYLAPYCRTASVFYGSRPELTSPTYGTIVVLFDPNNYVSGKAPPQLYQIQFREKGAPWNVLITRSLQKSNEDSIKEKKISEKIEGLKTGTLYEVKLLLIDAYFLKYDGDLVQTAEILTKCEIPSSYDYKVTTASNNTAITFFWRYIIEDQHWCPLETFEVTWREGWKRKTLLTKDNFTLNDLLPGIEIKFKVRAKTSKGFAPYSKTIIATTLQNEFSPVQNLILESSQSTSAEISWEPPRGSGDSQLRYTISYKCVDRPACSIGCLNVSEGQLTQEATSITLSPLLPFTKYMVTVSAESGVESSIYIGTIKVVPTEVPSLSAERPVRTNTSVTVSWEQGPVCTGYLLGFNYQLIKKYDDLNILESGFTKETTVSFHNLTASTEYIVKVYVSTVAGWNPLSYLAINVSTSATVPEAVKNLTVYKRGRNMLGLRWAEPQAIYGQLKSFTVTHSLGQDTISYTLEPSHCVIWPELYCHTIEGLRANRRYNITISARNAEVAEDGELVFISAVTKESPPSAPVNLKVTNSSSTSIELGWNFPEMPNGIVRSFLISVEETEKYDQDSCCQVYPFVETLVKEELKIYSAEVSGLHPASTYFVSVSGKTVGLGPSQSLVAYTRPPHLPLTSLPRTEVVSETCWLPQEKLPEVNNSEAYTSLVKSHLLLAVLNESQAFQVPMESGITDPKLDALLRQKIRKPFYFIAEYEQDEAVKISETLEDSDSLWGRPPASLFTTVKYQLVATQVLEYNGVYNVDLRYSQPFTLLTNL